MPPRAERIRLVHLINQLGRGGSEKQLALVLGHFDTTRFENRVVVFNPSRYEAFDGELIQSGVEVTHLPETVRGVLRRLLFLRRLLRRSRPHVLHSWSVHDNPYAGILGRWLGVPVAWGSMRGSIRLSFLVRLPALLHLPILRLVDALVVNSRSIEEELLAVGLPRERIHRLANCVEIRDDTEPADLSALGIGPGVPLVGAVGNLRPVKHHEMLVRAVARLVPRHPEVRAVIVGQPIPGEERYAAEIEREIERAGLVGRLVLTGFRDDVPAILQRLDVFCLTSKSEGMPNAVLEAMAVGKPVVATRVGGVPELVRDGENGLLVESGDVEGLARALRRLLEQPEEARRLGKDGRQRAAEEHDCRRAAARLERLYQAALARKRR